MVLWKRNNEILKSDINLNIINEGNRHILKILHTKKSDFGNYTCMAENSVGEENKHVLLSGKPTPAELVSAAPSPAGGEVHLQYRIESNSPIVEYQLEYRVKGESVSHFLLRNFSFQEFDEDVAKEAVATTLGLL